MHEARIDQIVLEQGEQRTTYAFPKDREAAFEAISEAQSSAQADDVGAPTAVTYYLTSKDGEALDWATRWQNTGLLVFEDLDQDGMINLKLKKDESVESSVARSEVAKIDKDIIVLSTPEVAGLPPWVIALVAAGDLQPRCQRQRGSCW